MKAMTMMMTDEMMLAPCCQTTLISQWVMLLLFLWSEIVRIVDAVGVPIANLWSWTVRLCEKGALWQGRIHLACSSGCFTRALLVATGAAGTSM